MYRCEEADCDEKFDDRNEYLVHSSYHDYHQKIRDAGKEKLKLLETKLNMKIKCPLEDRLEGCYYFPQLPTRLICEWEQCHCEYLSAELFYEHVANHAHRLLDKCYWSNCNKVFKNVTLAVLRDHLRVHTLQKLYACPHCGYFFSTKIKFNDHFLRHLNLSDLLRDREACPAVVVHNNQDLQFDIEEYDLGSTAGRVKVFKCTHENCDKAFLTSSLLREHIRIHSNKYQCDECRFIAKSASQLESHKLYRHQDERNFKCNICPKAFKQRGDLRAHIRRHQIVEPYRCDKCEFETLNEEGLTKHSKLHSRTHEYCCHICRRLFSRGNNLSRHLKEQHRVEPPNGLCRFKYKLSQLGFYLVDTGDDSEMLANFLQDSDEIDQIEQIPSV